MSQQDVTLRITIPKKMYKELTIESLRKDTDVSLHQIILEILENHLKKQSSASKG